MRRMNPKLAQAGVRWLVAVSFSLLSGVVVRRFRVRSCLGTGRRTNAADACTRAGSSRSSDK